MNINRMLIFRIMYVSACVTISKYRITCIYIDIDVVYNIPLYYCCPCYIQCILLLQYYRITIILLLFSSRTSEGAYFSANKPNIIIIYKY